MPSSEFQRGMLRAIAIAEMYADENIRMASDTVACDPILNPKARARIRNQAALDAAMKVSEELQLDGFDHASKHKAGLDIAELIRTEAGRKRCAKDIR